jgi:hypothetical protein
VDFDYESDLRNTKHLMEEGGWSNQSFNTSETKRIYYIKEKKNMQREEQLKREMEKSKLNDFIEQADGPPKKSKKRELKSNQNGDNFQKVDSDSDKKGKNFYKNKKK